MTEIDEGAAGPFQNTDREIWRERAGDHYADSIHVTKEGSIGIDCGGTVYVMPVREWHQLASSRRAQTKRSQVSEIDEKAEHQAFHEYGQNRVLNSHLATWLAAVRSYASRRAQAEAGRSVPDDLRRAGWTVAVHNDYRLNGEPHTFWLLTKDGRALKGEGLNDVEALNQIRAQLSPPTQPTFRVLLDSGCEITASIDTGNVTHIHDVKYGPTKDEIASDPKTTTAFNEPEIMTEKAIFSVFHGNFMVRHCFRLASDPLRRRHAVFYHVSNQKQAEWLCSALLAGASSQPHPDKPGEPDRVKVLEQALRRAKEWMIAAGWNKAGVLVGGGLIAANAVREVNQALAGDAP